MKRISFETNKHINLAGEKVLSLEIEGLSIYIDKDAVGNKTLSLFQNGYPVMEESCFLELEYILEKVAEALD